MTEDLMLQKSDGEITTITINRADIGNRVSDDLVGRLSDQIDVAAKDSRAIVLKAAGQEFCLGREVMGEKGRLKEALETRDNFEVVFKLYDTFRQVSVPVIVEASICPMKISGPTSPVPAVCSSYKPLPSVSVQVPSRSMRNRSQGNSSGPHASCSNHADGNAPTRTQPRRSVEWLLIKAFSDSAWVSDRV